MYIAKKNPGKKAGIKLNPLFLEKEKIGGRGRRQGMGSNKET